MAPPPPSFGPADETDLHGASLVLSRAFSVLPEQSVEWMRDRVTLSETRVLREDDVVLATSMRIPMGMWLGGASVPHVGIAGVAVGPQARGRGLARDIMRRCLLEMHERGEHVSTLYSAMEPLYRSVGFDYAGHIYTVRVAAGMLASTDRGADWREMTNDDAAAVEACANDRARHVPAALDRGPYVWHRVRNPKTGPAQAFVAESDSGEIEAYCIYRVEPRHDGHVAGNARGNAMHLVDHGYSTARGLDRLLGFLRGFSSVVGEIEFTDHPGSPLIQRMPDRRFTLEMRDPWMLRTVDVAGALAARGYAPALSCEFTLQVRDELIEANNTPIRVRIRDGRAETGPASSASRDAIRLDVRHLAPLYTGLQSARQLASVGLIEGPAPAIADLDAAFASTAAPCMFDHF